MPNVHDEPSFPFEELLLGALPREKTQLQHIFRRLSKLSEVRPASVKLALSIEVLNEYDYREWPSEFVLHGLIDDYQKALLHFTETACVDFFQRFNYLTLALAGCNRQHDVAHGLSEVLDWTDEVHVVENLLLMGRRQYDGPVPQHSDMDNMVLHVAVSYKHVARYDAGGTLSPRQAAAIWRAVRAHENFDQARGVRVWLDQNLHRGVGGLDAEWHEYGLLPYACLPVIYIGDGDCSVRLAASRPWLWVELLAGVKASGVLTEPGRDIIAEAPAVLRPTELYAAMPSELQRRGYVISFNGGVDSVMDGILRLVALWRPRGFLEHEGYEYAADFHRFVDWARRFVLRGVPYSRMRGNHSSDAVVGMDAVALVRALPHASGGLNDANRMIVEPVVSWESRSATSGTRICVVGDILDRTQIDAIPLHVLLETQYEQKDDSTDVVLLGEGVANTRMRFRVQGDKMTTVLSSADASTSVIHTRKSAYLHALYKDMVTRANVVRVSVPSSEDVGLVTYSPFTSRFFLSIGLAKVAVGDAVLVVRKLPPALTPALRLRAHGICTNHGITEMVYELDRGAADEAVLVSTNEAMTLFAVAKRDLQEMVRLIVVLKRNTGYKQTWFEDQTDDEVLEMAAGWPLSAAERMRTNPRIVSGELSDVRTDVVETLRARDADRTLVTVQLFTDDEVQIVYRTPRSITYARAPKRGVLWGMSLVERSRGADLISANGRGVLQVMSRISVPDNATTIVEALNGLFCVCDECDRVVCPLNGLVAAVEEADCKYFVSWSEAHRCSKRVYRPFRPFRS